MFAPWSDDVPYKEVKKTLRLPDRTTKNYWDAQTVGGYLWEWGMSQKVKLMPVRVVLMKGNAK